MPDNIIVRDNVAVITGGTHGPGAAMASRDILGQKITRRCAQYRTKGRSKSSRTRKTELVGDLFDRNACGQKIQRYVNPGPLLPISETEAGIPNKQSGKRSL